LEKREYNRITKQSDWRAEMKSLFSKFKREPQRETKVVCSNLTVANDCQLVSEIKNYQTRLDAIELEIKALKRSNDDISACWLLFNNPEMRRLYFELWSSSGHNPISRDILVDALCGALKHTDLGTLIKELTMLDNKEATLKSKESEASELRKKITEAKTALGIK
jgi:hypothetical protein